jgi:hypothetical protein
MTPVPSDRGHRRLIDQAGSGATYPTMDYPVSPHEGLTLHRHIQLHEAFSRNNIGFTRHTADVVDTRSAVSAGFGDQAEVFLV